MHWLAAVFTALFYLYNIPVAAAFVWNEDGLGVALRPFSGAAALGAARRKINGAKKTFKKPGGRMLAPPMTALRVAASLLPHIRLEFLRAQARLGLDDAALTAILCGALGAALHMLGCHAGECGGISVTADFEKPCAQINVRAVISARAGDALRAALRGVIKRRAK